MGYTVNRKIEFMVKKMQKKAIINKFNERLKRLRKSLGLTQDEMSLALAVSKPTYVRYEAGGMLPKISFLVLLQKKFDANTNWLVHGEGSMLLDNDYTAMMDILGRVQGEERAQLVELLRLMAIPQVHIGIMAELAKLKQIFKEEVAAQLAR